MRKDDTMPAPPLFASATVPVMPLSADARLHLLNTEHGDLDAPSPRWPSAAMPTI